MRKQLTLPGFAHLIDDDKYMFSLSCKGSELFVGPYNNYPDAISGKERLEKKKIPVSGPYIIPKELEKALIKEELLLNQ